MLSLLLPALAALPAAHAWGDLGHETIAYVAQNFVNSQTKTWAQNILGDTSSSYLANVATWADTYRYTSEGSWSEPFHFIDAEDNPPSSCNVEYSRDCGNSGCSVSAIANYTTRVQSSTLPASEVLTALKFIVHFVGDITQPLHDENYEYGANDVYVTYDGSSTNLHHIWDTNMPESLRGTTSASLSTAESWATNLTAMINSGPYASQKASWVSGLNVNEAVTTAMGWATDANAYVCSTVMPNGPKVLEDAKDLYPTYYDTVIDTLELQVAKAGYRLAAWLDAIAAQAPTRASGRASGKTTASSYVGRRTAAPNPDAHLDLTGRSFLPPMREMDPQKLRRLAMGRCNHRH